MKPERPPQVGSPPGKAPRRSIPRRAAAAAAQRRAMAAVAACAVLAYGVACAGAFVYDDHHSVADNVALRSLGNVPAFFWDVDLFSALNNRMYRPVLLTTLALNHAVAGGAAWAYKATNVLLHAGAAVLLFCVARRLGLGRRAALAGGVLFAVHPLASEAVNMVSGRSELLLLTGLLAAVWSYAAALRGARWGPLAAAAAAVVACGSKETGVVVPVLLVAVELLWGRRARRGLGPLAARLAPSCVAVGAYLGVRRLLLGAATVPSLRLESGGDLHTGATRDLVTQLATMAQELPGCLAKVLAPTSLSLDPPIEFTRNLLAAAPLGGMALAAALTWLGLRRPRRRRAVALGTVLAWATALPWILVPLNVPLCEHRMYGPLAGIALAVAGAWPGRLRAPAWAAAAAAAAVLAGISAEQSLAYRDELQLWHRAHQLNPRSYRAAYSIGACLMKRGDLPAARTWMERALALYPDYVSAAKNCAEINLQLGPAGDAVRADQLATWLVERAPRDPFYRLLKSRALTERARRAGDAALYDEAVRTALGVLAIAEPKGLVYRTAAHARRVQGRLAAALELLDESVERGLDHSSVLLDRAEVRQALGLHAEALADVRRAGAVDPFEPRVAALLAELSLPHHR